VARIEVPETLAGATVRLRALAERDAPAYAAAFREDPDLGRLLGLPSDPDERWAQGHTRRCSEAAERGEWLELAIRDPDTDDFLGVVMLLRLDWLSRRCELGYWLTLQSRRKGLASGAVALALDWAFMGLDLLRVEIATTVENLPSQKLARRHGFTEEALQRARDVERGRRLDVIQFGLLREEYMTAAV
jgi:[ribosomal protein S5]-alanine N-acetyltransferase